MVCIEGERLSRAVGLLPPTALFLAVKEFLNETICSGRVLSCMMILEDWSSAPNRSTISMYDRISTVVIDQ